MTNVVSVLSQAAFVVTAEELDETAFQIATAAN
jgi:hypothetical protein